MAVTCIVVFILFGTGGSINPMVWPSQFERRLDPSSLITLEDPLLDELDEEFIFFQRNLIEGVVEPCFIEETSIFHDIFCFISRKIMYNNDYSVYYSLDYLAKPSEVLFKGADDCDGKAVLINVMLERRGYDSFVVMGTEHTWVEVNYGKYNVYISRINSEEAVIITEEPLPEDSTWYVKFNSSSANWRLFPLLLQIILVSLYIFLVLTLLQVIYIRQLYVRPVSYISEIFGYFRYIFYMFILIFSVWLFILLLLEYIDRIQ